MSDSVGTQKENGVNFGNINALVIQIYNKDKADFTGDQTLSGFSSFLIAGSTGKGHAGDTLR